MRDITLKLEYKELTHRFYFDLKLFPSESDNEFFSTIEELDMAIDLCDKAEAWLRNKRAKLRQNDIKNAEELINSKGNKNDN